MNEADARFLHAIASVNTNHVSGAELGPVGIAIATSSGFGGLGSLGVGVVGTPEKPDTVWALPLPAKSINAPMCSVPPRSAGS